MNEPQLKELYFLLDMFSKRYPDRSPESVRQTLKEALKGLSEVKPMKASDEAEYNSCQLFDSGRFNDIVLAYVILSMRKAGTATDEAMKLLGSLEASFDELTAQQALQLYRGGIEK